MGLFGFGTKRKPAAEPAVSEPKLDVDARSGTSWRTDDMAGTGGRFAATRRDRLNTPITRQRTDQQAGVEVSEFNLDDDDFSSMFGSTTSQFADATFEQDDRAGDPWFSKRRLD